MTHFNADDSENVNEAKLPKRDWILLPLIGLLTICLLAVSSEAIAPRLLNGGKHWSTTACIMHDPLTGIRGIPNCVYWEEKPEVKPVENIRNACGHRAGMDCGPKTPDTYRIVMTGSSLPEGEEVQREMTFAALLPAELSRLTGRKVELYNEAIVFRNPRNVDLRFIEITAAQPNAILWVLDPRDIRDTEDPLGFAQLGVMERIKSRIKFALNKGDFPSAIREIANNITASLIARLHDNTITPTLIMHILYQDRNEYVKLYLMGDRLNNGFLRDKLDSNWQYNLKDFDHYFADIERQAKDAGVPLVVTLVPNRAQAAMISMGEWPAGYDPYKLGDELRAIVTRHGGIYIDILPDFRAIPSSELGYFAVDGHLNPDGHAIVSRLLAKELTDGSVPALKAAAQPQYGLEQEK